MAWSWSHTPEAYANLEELPLETLRVIEAEWYAAKSNYTTTRFSEWHYVRELNRLTRGDIPAYILAESIWVSASEQATCDNDGYNAWMCPFGCHTVSFDRNEHPLYEQWLALKQDGSTRMTFEQYKACST